jgi:hypothetical protein
MGRVETGHAPHRRHHLFFRGAVDFRTSATMDVLVYKTRRQQPLAHVRNREACRWPTCAYPFY